MEKKLTFLLTILIIALSLTSCSKPINNNSVLILSNADAGTMQKTETNQVTTSEMAIEIYNEFLAGNISCLDGNDIVDIDYLTFPTGEPDRRLPADYAFFDSTGDGIPELHVTSKYYYVFTIRSGELVVWRSFNNYFLPLKNKAFMSYHPTGFYDTYSYYVFDYAGDEVFNLSFSKYCKDDGDVKEYIFDGVEVIEEQWDKLTERYLYTDEKGIERIRNEIEWTVLFEGTN
ncbi:MAG: hypothetical protein LBT43_11250 [Prevotella sp.]|jgi:hypothetical protein|nr:hypothetical protein [Prevotella sp.]